MPAINDPVFAPHAPQSVRLLSAMVHDTSLPYKSPTGGRKDPDSAPSGRTRTAAGRAGLARTGTLREREHEREVIGWT